ncbi:MAG: response regulator [Novosphingobium sp.]
MPDAGLVGRRVLVVEDEYLLATDLAHALEKEAAEVIGPVPSVAQAMALIADGTDIHLGLLDINLGGELVYPVADALAALGVPFLFVTGYDARAIPPRFQNVPRLEKPVQVAAVMRAVALSIEPHRL